MTFTKECDYCDNHQQVILDKASGSDKWTVTNLDGSVHKHVKYGPQSKQKQETVTISDTVATTKPMVTHEEEAKITASLRSEAIATAHKENMEESEKLRTSIGNLEMKIDDASSQIYSLTKQLGSLTELIRSYLDAKQNV